jgi:hypothetical protein
LVFLSDFHWLGLEGPETGVEARRVATSSITSVSSVSVTHILRPVDTTANSVFIEVAMDITNGSSL